MSRHITRRTMLAGGTAGLLAAPWVARAQANTLRIGMQSILSGPIALLGTSSRNSLMMEQDRINAAGGFLGRPIEFVFRDFKRPTPGGRTHRARTREQHGLRVADRCRSVVRFLRGPGSRARSGRYRLHPHQQRNLVTDRRPQDPRTYRLPRRAPGRARCGGWQHLSLRLRQRQETQQMGDLFAGLRLRSRHHRAVPAVLQAVQAGRSKSSPRPGPSSANPTSPKSSPS